MAKYQPKRVIYPLTNIEYHVVTSAGVPAYITNSLDLAKAKFKHSDPSYKLVAVETIQRDITPRRRNTAPKSSTVSDIATARGLQVTDVEPARLAEVA